jgi:hypothetical protein
MANLSGFLPVHTLNFVRTLKAIWALLDAMHQVGFYHFDAKINNIIVLKQSRPNAVRIPSSKYCLYMIDFETV